MPKIGWSFKGWISGADIREVTETETGNVIDVSKMSAAEVADKLNACTWLIALGDHLYSSKSIENFDFEADGSD